MSIAAFRVELEQWARLGGIEHRKIENGIRFSDDGGEVQDYVRKQGALFVVTSAIRNGDERFVMSSASGDSVAKYLTDSFGTSVRAILKLRFLMMPVKVEDVALGWSVVHGDGVWVASSEATGQTGLFHADSGAVAFTHYGNRAIEEIRASYLDPEGRPYTVLDRV